ncbi:hypothetical protein ACQ5SO_19040 [Rhodovulum sp. DZ06]|uniref:hypothetical protein n=1 Tax=Rhodovulum sp. DZ06 TaxID=3425126 RepID=UPI003D346F04
MRAISALAAAAALFATTASAVPVAVDLSGWTSEGAGTWTVQTGNDSVLQTQNGSPTVFYSAGNSQGLALAGQITVQTTSDDDFIGFVLGYHAGDLSNASADFLLIDWKQLNQGLYSGTGTAGLAISRVTGVLGDNSGAWWHDPTNNVNEIQRAATLGATGWADNTTYDFELVFQPTVAQVYVNGALELNITAADAGVTSFNNGAFGFYNYSQPNVLYAGITEETAPPLGDVPLPAGALLLPAALLGLGALRRRA